MMLCDIMPSMKTIAENANDFADLRTLDGGLSFGSKTRHQTGAVREWRG